MKDYSYFFIKNTQSYDRAAAILKFLQADAHSICKDAVMRFIAENFYIKFDHGMLGKSDLDDCIDSSLLQTKKSFEQYKKTLFPNIKATIVHEKTYFYFLFSNLDAYEAEDFILTNKIIPLQKMNLPNIANIYNSFYLETIFFDCDKINFDFFEIQKYKPTIEFRAEQQIKIILQEQIINKNHSISRTEIMKINNTTIENKNVNLMAKVKAAIIKAEGGIDNKKSISI